MTSPRASRGTLTPQPWTRRSPGNGMICSLGISISCKMGLDPMAPDHPIGASQSSSVLLTRQRLTSLVVACTSPSLPVGLDIMLVHVFINGGLMIRWDLLSHAYSSACLSALTTHSFPSPSIFTFLGVCGKRCGNGADCSGCAVYWIPPSYIERVQELHSIRFLCSCPAPWFYPSLLGPGNLGQSTL